MKHSGLKWDVSIKFFLSEVRKSHRRGGERIIEPGGMQDNKRIRLSK